jgi:hypothetical protein
MILKKLFLVVLLQFVFLKAFCQLEQYYHKIEQVAYTEKSAEHLFKRIDSIKQTRRPNDSRVSVYFNRNVDFGYKHQRINITFNGINQYTVNLLTKNDAILFCSVLYVNSGMQEEDEEKLNLKQNHPKIDTVQIIKYLTLRNKFYDSSKKIENLIGELNMNKVYAFYCGDGGFKTQEGKAIEAIVKHKDIHQLGNMLRSMSCEE